MRFSSKIIICGGLALIFFVTTFVEFFSRKPLEGIGETTIIESYELFCDYNRSEPERIMLSHSPLVSNYGCKRTYQFRMSYSAGVGSELIWLTFGALYAFVTDRTLQVENTKWNYGNYMELFNTSSTLLNCSIPDNQLTQASHTCDDERHAHIWTQRDWNGLRPLGDKKSWMDRTQHIKLDTLRALTSALYKHSSNASSTIAQIRQLELIGSLPENESYIAIHIRTGDKAGEQPELDLQFYIHCLNNLVEQTNITNIFIASDSNTSIAVIKELKSQWNIFHFLTNSTGHYQAHFNTLPEAFRKRAALQLMAEIDFLQKADHVICTISSNVCLLVQLIRTQPFETVHSLDMPMMSFIPTNISLYCPKINLTATTSAIGLQV
jgi:hypothetical protein